MGKGIEIEQYSENLHNFQVNNLRKRANYWMKKYFEK